MATITRRDLVDRISDRIGRSRATTGDVVQSFIDEIIEELGKGNRLEFREFGVFDVRERAARKARNPKTGATVHIPSRIVVRFKPGRIMKARVNGLGAPAVTRSGGTEGSAAE